MMKILKIYAVLAVMLAVPRPVVAQTSELIPTDYEMMAEAIDELSDGRALVVQERLRARPHLTTRSFEDFFRQMRAAFPGLSEIAIQDYANRNALAYPLIDDLVLRDDWRYGRADAAAATALAREAGGACAVEARVPGVDWTKKEALAYVWRVCSNGLQDERYVVLNKQGRIWIAFESFDPNAPAETDAASE